MISKEDYNFLLNRIDELFDQVNRVKYVLVNYESGIPDDFVVDEIYTEAANKRDKTRSHMARIIEHLLKLKYCTNNRNHNGWSNSVIVHQAEVNSLTHYFGDQDKDLINKSKLDLDSAYIEGVNLYKNAELKYKDLKLNEKFIPEKCPWSFDYLMTYPIPYLLDKLPDPDELTVQMQLYPFCKYYDDKNTDIDGLLCINCNMYAECISKYYEENTRD